MIEIDEEWVLRGHGDDVSVKVLLRKKEKHHDEDDAKQGEAEDLSAARPAPRYGWIFVVQLTLDAGED